MESKQAVLGYNPPSQLRSAWQCACPFSVISPIGFSYSLNIHDLHSISVVYVGPFIGVINFLMNSTGEIAHSMEQIINDNFED